MKSSKYLLAVLFLGAALIVPAVHAQKEGPPGGKGGRGDMVKMMTEQLQLTDAQVAQIKPILDDQQKALMAIRDDSSLEQEAKRTKRGEIMTSHRAQIRAVLTAEQQTKFDEMRPGGGVVARAKEREKGRVKAGKLKAKPGASVFF